MISYGPSLRRKSFQRLDPTMPKPKQRNREPSSNARTIYKQLRSPGQELKDYKKKQLFTMGNMSTQRSMSNIHQEELQNMHSRFDYDQHTDSIALLFEGKNESGHPTVRNKISEVEVKLSASQKESISDQKMSLQSDSIAQKDQLKSSEMKEYNEEEGREGENYDDYVLGDRVEYEQENEEANTKTFKKYAINHSLSLPDRYICQGESQLRQQQSRYNIERRKLLQIKEDQQIKQMMLEYRLNKQKILSQSTKKHETARMIASIRQPAQIKAVQKSTSLPALRAKQIFVIPEENEQSKVIEPWRNSGNLISKSVERRSDMQDNKLKQTLSYAKLGFGRKKIRTICEQDILEEEMVALDQIKEKLRAKGIKFDSKKLAQGFVHNTNPNFDSLAKTLEIPANSLPSNPLYKKFPL